MTVTVRLMKGIALLVLVGALCSAQASAQETSAPPTQPPATAAEEPTIAGGSAAAESSRPVLPVFRGQIEVNLVNIFVTVVDRKGNPVGNLTQEDFSVYEDGEPMEITNFAAIQREPGSGGAFSGGAHIQVPLGEDSRKQPSYVAFLFDNISLQKRNRRRLMEFLEGFMREGRAEREQYLVALNNGQLEILSGFQPYGAGVTATLDRVADIPTSGETVKRGKRYLKRTVFRAELFRAELLMGNTQFNEDWARAQGTMLMTEINALRRREYERIRQSLDVVRDLVRAMAGLPGRKTVVWLGEDLALRPAIDIYAAFYRKAILLTDLLNLTRPETWGDELSLTNEFQTVAAAAQACGTTLFIIDASDRDVELGTADYSPPSVDAIVAAEAGGSLWTPGTDFAEVRLLSEGAEYLALATGGTAVTRTREAEQFVDQLQDHLDTYYSIAYRRPGDPDGNRHSVQVKVAGTGLRVRHHEKILNRTAPQRLVDLTLSRLRLDTGLNPLELGISFGDAQPAESGQYILPVQLTMPVAKMTLLPDGERQLGQVLIAVVAIDEEQHTATPQLLRLRLAIPNADYSPDSLATQTIRLLMREGTHRIAIGVRDEVSGLEATEAVPLPAL